MPDILDAAANPSLTGSDPVNPPTPILSGPAGDTPGSPPSSIPISPISPITPTDDPTDSLIVKSASPPVPLESKPPDPPPHISLTKRDPASPDPMSPPSKKGPGKGVLISIVLFLLLTLPLSIKLIAGQRQLADVRTKAYSSCLRACRDDAAPGTDCDAACAIPEDVQRVIYEENPELKQHDRAVEERQQQETEERDRQERERQNTLPQPSGPDYQLPQPPGPDPNQPLPEPPGPDYQLPQPSASEWCWFGNSTNCPGHGTTCVAWGQSCPAPPSSQPAEGCTGYRPTCDGTHVLACENGNWICKSKGAQSVGGCQGYKPTCNEPEYTLWCENENWVCKPTAGQSVGGCSGYKPTCAGLYELQCVEENWICKSTAAPSPSASSGYCDRSSPNTGDCTDKRDGTSCNVSGGGSGTCRIIVSGGANTECACVASGPPPPPTDKIQPPGEGGTPSPTQPPPGPQCTQLKVYKSGQVVTDYTTLRSGDAVQLTLVAGSAAKSRIRVNGGSWNETTTKNSAGAFVVDFTIPAATTNFTVEGEIFTNGNWQ